MKPSPNFFIVGAPKCGTTALHQYLGEHPSIFMSNPKEPCYWATDFPNAKRGSFVNMETLEDYLYLFATAQPEHRWLGESSTFYLYSKDAIKNILAFSPKAKFLAMVRNPIDLVFSLHSQMVYGFGEDEKDFEKAWDLQDLRLKSQRIPAGCYVPEMLQYRNVGRLGQQVQRLINLVPEEQRLVLMFEDFASAPQATYLKVLNFLGLPDDGRQLFEPVNEKRSHKFPWLSRLIRKPPASLFAPMNMVRRFVNSTGARASKWIKATLTSEEPKRTMSHKMRMRLVNEFSEDVQLLSDLLNKDLQHWLKVCDNDEIKESNHSRREAIN